MGGFFVRAASSKPMRCIPLPTARLGAESADMLSAARYPYEARMTAEIYQIRDFQSAKERERMRQALEKEAAEILKQVDTGPSEMIPFGVAGIDGMWTDKDPA